MDSSKFNKVVIIVLATLIVVDGGLFAYVKMGNYYTRQDSSFLYRHKADQGVVTPPDGFDVKGERISIPQSRTPGWAVRYAAPGCEFCRQDEPRWEQLSAALQSMGYKITTVVPTAKDEYPDESQTPKGSSQMSFVSMEWVKKIRLTGTPTLLLFDAHQGLIWSHVGALDPGDPAAALKSASSAMRAGSQTSYAVQPLPAMARMER